MLDHGSFLHRLWHRAHRIDSWLLVGFMISTLVLFGLAVLAEEILEGDSFAFDQTIISGLRLATDPAQAIAPGWVTSAMIDITAMGGGTILSFVTIFAVGYLLAIGRQRIALFVAAVIVTGAILTDLLKSLFSRARPDLVPHLVEVHSLSFPSGHSMNSALVYLTLAALVARTRTDTGVRIYLMSAALLLTFLVGVSRVYLGVHWPTDVLAGWGVGALWAALASLIAKRLQEKHEIEPPSEGEEVEKA
ncbi:phosphatase PAP2 family protein [Sphingomicrobium sp. XHP0235]|uniref:phosphatase PAP2 family protein n=1 Tax=Sphingomicrobium aquimarinum TaxID=3133971 RepID=UPI0031FE7000